MQHPAWILVVIGLVIAGIGAAWLTLEIAGNRRTSIMCAEGDYRHCHRRLLCDHLLASGVAVLHIWPTGEVKPHSITSGAKVVERTVTYPGQPTLFQM